MLCFVPLQGLQETILQGPLKKFVSTPHSAGQPRLEAKESFRRTKLKNGKKINGVCITELGICSGLMERNAILAISAAPTHTSSVPDANVGIALLADTRKYMNSFSMTPKLLDS